MTNKIRLFLFLSCLSYFIPDGNFDIGFDEIGEAFWEGDWLPVPPPRHLEHPIPSSCQYLSPNVFVIVGVVRRQENKEEAGDEPDNWLLGAPAAITES